MNIKDEGAHLSSTNLRFVDIAYTSSLHSKLSSDDLKIIITVPHSLCFDNVNFRHCDFLAKRAAQSLNGIIPYNKILLLGSILREHSDLNRKESRSTNYRKHLTSILSNITNGILIDVHSFFEGEHNNNDVVILDDPPKTKYSSQLYQLLKQKGLKTEYFEGKDNDIIKEARSYGLKAVLIEYHEDRPKNINKINQVVLSWLNLIKNDIN